MYNHKQTFGIFISLCLLCSLLTSCQAGGLLGPTLTPSPLPTLTPSLTPTVTSTPEPQRMNISDLLNNCQALSDHKREVILSGKIYLPEGSIFGYKTEGDTWWGLQLVTSEKITVLVKMGDGPGTMDALPEQYSWKDLVVRAADGQKVLTGHQVLITGRPKYRTDNPERACEVFASTIVSQESPDVLIPIDLQVKDLFDADRKNDCSILTKTSQLVRLSGALTVDKDTSCWMNECALVLKDATGKVKVVLSTLGNRNMMTNLTPPYQSSDLQVFDWGGEQGDGSRFQLVGVVTGTDEFLYCSLKVYEIYLSE